MSAPKKANKPRGNAARNKSSQAGKRSEQGAKAAQTTPPKAPAGDKSKNVVKPSEEQENKQEQQNLLMRLIAWLRAALSWKKGERAEFRYNYDEEHPGYVFKEEDGKLKSFGITHSDTTFGIGNMPLEENPDKSDTDAAYIRNGVITSKKRRNGGRMKNMQLSPNDKAKVKSKKRNYKKIAKQQKAKNKKSK